MVTFIPILEQYKTKIKLLEQSSTETIPYLEKSQQLCLEYITLLQKQYETLQSENTQQANDVGKALAISFQRTKHHIFYVCKKQIFKRISDYVQLTTESPYTLIESQLESILKVIQEISNEETIQELVNIQLKLTVFYLDQYIKTRTKIINDKLLDVRNHQSSFIMMRTFIGNLQDFFQILNSLTDKMRRCFFNELYGGDKHLIQLLDSTCELFYLLQSFVKKTLEIFNKKLSVDFKEALGVSKKILSSNKEGIFNDQGKYKQQEIFKDTLDFIETQSCKDINVGSLFLVNELYFLSDFYSTASRFLFEKNLGGIGSSKKDAYLTKEKHQEQTKCFNEIASSTESIFHKVKNTVGFFLKECSFSNIIDTFLAKQEVKLESCQEYTKEIERFNLGRVNVSSAKELEEMYLKFSKEESPENSIIKLKQEHGKLKLDNIKKSRKEEKILLLLIYSYSLRINNNFHSCENTRDSDALELLQFLTRVDNQLASLSNQTFIINCQLFLMDIYGELLFSNLNRMNKSFSHIHKNPNKFSRAKEALIFLGPLLDCFDKFFSSYNQLSKKQKRKTNSEEIDMVTSNLLEYIQDFSSFFYFAVTKTLLPREMLEGKKSVPILQLQEGEFASLRSQIKKTREEIFRLNIEIFNISIKEKNFKKLEEKIKERSTQIKLLGNRKNQHLLNEMLSLLEKFELFLPKAISFSKSINQNRKLTKLVALVQSSNTRRNKYERLMEELRASIKAIDNLEKINTIEDLERAKKIRAEKDNELLLEEKKKNPKRVKNKKGTKKKEGEREIKISKKNQTSIKAERGKEEREPREKNKGGNKITLKKKNLQSTSRKKKNRTKTKDGTIEIKKEKKETEQDSPLLLEKAPILLRLEKQAKNLRTKASATKKVMGLEKKNGVPGINPQQLYASMKRLFANGHYPALNAAVQKKKIKNHLEQSLSSPFLAAESFTKQGIYLFMLAEERLLRDPNNFVMLTRSYLTAKIFLEKALDLFETENTESHELFDKHIKTIEDTLTLCAAKINIFDQNIVHQMYGDLYKELTNNYFRKKGIDDYLRYMNLRLRIYENIEDIKILIQLVNDNPTEILNMTLKNKVIESLNFIKMALKQRKNACANIKQEEGTASAVLNELKKDKIKLEKIRGQLTEQYQMPLDSTKIQPATLRNR